MELGWFGMLTRFSQLALLFLVFLILTPGGISAQTEKSDPRAEKGVIDLRGYDFQQDGTLTLAGEWGFYWDTAITEDSFDDFLKTEPDLYAEVPSYWDDIEDSELGITPQGFATYSLRILTDPAGNSGALALKFLNITPNADIYIDGLRIAEIGKVDPNRELSKSGNRILLIPVPDSDNGILLTVGISNYHNVNGGLNRPIQFGRYVDVLRIREQLLSLDAIFLGGLMLMGLYQLSLFLLDRKHKAPIFMALLCFLAFFFSGFKNEMVLLSLFPGWSGEIRTKFIYLALTLSAPTFLLYAYNLYAAHFRKGLNWIPVSIALLFTFIILLTPNAVYTMFIIPLEIMVLISAVYTIVKLILGYVKSRDRLILYYLGGLGFLLASIIFGMIDNEISVVFQSVAGTFFIFILYQAFLQAHIFSTVFTEIDHLSLQKSKLEKRNVELFSLSYIDSLTETCNRRLMDDFLTSNWRVNAFSERSVGMILIDIDDFKFYNEFYGHRQGDVCLVKVCELIRDELGKHGQYTLARYGGEEFAVIVSDMDELTLFRIAEKLRLAVEAGGISHQNSRAADVVTISIGCASLIPARDTEPESLLDAADKALHRAKSKGRNRTELYSSETNAVSFGPRLV